MNFFIHLDANICIHKGSFRTIWEKPQKNTNLLQERHLQGKKKPNAYVKRKFRKINFRLCRKWENQFLLGIPKIFWRVIRWNSKRDGSFDPTLIPQVPSDMNQYVYSHLYTSPLKSIFSMIHFSFVFEKIIRIFHFRIL